MRGRLYVDGNDAYLRYGVYVTGNGWNELIAWAPLKEPEKNDWQEEDGVEADLSEPTLDTREVNIPFCFTGQVASFEAFVAMLSDGAYHDFQVSTIGRRFTLRFVSQGAHTYNSDFETVALRFADDFPPEFKFPLTPETTISFPVSDGYELDGMTFAQFGAIVLQGSLAEVRKQPTAKTNLLRNIKTVNGVSYDSLNVTYQSKEVKLTLLMRASTLSELWGNYDALLYAMIRPDERTLYVDAVETEFQCYYKNSSVVEFFADGKIWLKFTISLVFVSTVSVGDFEDGTVLATEDGIIVFTEDDDFAIELRPEAFFAPSMRLVSKTALRLTADGNIRFNNRKS